MFLAVTPDSKRPKDVLCRKSHFDQLPTEMTINILNYLSQKDLARCSRVCTTWRRIISESFFCYTADDLKKEFSSLTIIGETFWKTLPSHFNLELKNLPPLDRRSDIPKLRTIVAALGTARIAVVTIPKNLTFAILIRIAHSKQRAPKFVCPTVREEQANIATDKAYRIVIAYNIKKGDRNLLTAYERWEQPRVIEALSFLISNRGQETYIRCSEPTSNKLEVAAGNFTDKKELSICSIWNESFKEAEYGSCVQTVLSAPRVPAFKLATPLP